MSDVDQTASVIVGATVSGVIGILVVFTQQWLSRRHQDRSEHVARLTEFSAAAWALTLAIGRLAHAPDDKKESVEERERVSALGDAFNSCMAKIQLLEGGAVYATAARLDRELAALVPLARDHEFETVEWRQARAGVTAAVEEFQRAARVSLGSGPKPAEIAGPPAPPV